MENGASPETPAKKTERIRRKIADLDHTDLGSSGFWLGQMMMVIATVIGVYLAAYTGLQQALEFDRLQTLQDNYYLRHSLHDELADNAEALERYATEVLAKNPGQTTMQSDRPSLDRFVWETMRFSNSTLETPSFFLTEARRFYDQSADILDKAVAQHYGASYAAEQLSQVVSRMQQTTLPALERNYTQLQNQLEKAGIQTQGLKER